MSLLVEVYSDYKSEIKSYTQDIVPTPYMFVRDYSIAISEFQKETAYIEASVQIDKASDGKFYVPKDYYRMLQVLTSEGKILDTKSPNQFDYRYRKQVVYNTDLGITYSNARDFYTVFNGEIVTGQDYDTLYVRYIPYLHPISEASEQWFNTKGTMLNATDVAVLNTPYRVMHGNLATGTAPTVSMLVGTAFTGDGLATVDLVTNPTYPTTFREIDIERSWYPYDTFFEDRFNTVETDRKISGYEPAFLAYCIAKYLKSQGSANYAIYFQDWQRQLKTAKENKPSSFGRGELKFYSLQQVVNYGVRCY
jgi:hypothetical protein